MIPIDIITYRNATSLYLGLKQRNLTARSILLLALDARGAVYIATPKNKETVSNMKVGDKFTLSPPWKGEFFYFDAIHKLPSDVLLWTGDRRLMQTGSGQDVANTLAEWMKTTKDKNLFLGCTPHQPGAWCSSGPLDQITTLHQIGIVDPTVSAQGLIARRIGEPFLYYLPWNQLNHIAEPQQWNKIYTSNRGNILFLERRILHHRIALSCEQGIIEVSLTDLPNVEVISSIRLESGFAIVGRIDGGAFAVTTGQVKKWGLDDILPAYLVGAENESLSALQQILGQLSQQDTAPHIKPIKS